MNSKKILFITPDLDIKIGGGIVTSVIENCLRNKALKCEKVAFSLYKRAFEKLQNMISGYAAGMTADVEKEIIDLVRLRDWDVVVFNTSYFGLTMRKLKKDNPDINIICFFHNVEFVFVRDALKRTRNIFSLLTLLVSWRNEKLSVKNSNLIICLNKRDSRDLKRIYNRNADYISPLCLEDNFDKSKLHSTDRVVGAFIGSNFYANYAGISWFAKKVAPFISAKILVIGKGFENCKEKLEVYPNIEVIGTVDDLAHFYYEIDFVVSPIFDGSGMKTKTAEALMYGKTIFGTTEAFQGYDINYEEVGGLCNSAQEFIDKIKMFRKRANQYNPYSRDCYLSKYSANALEHLLGNILK